MNLVKHISAILTCSVLGGMLMKMIEGVAHRLNPGISQLDKKDLNKVASYIESLPLMSIGIVLFAYFVGALAAAVSVIYMTQIWELGSGKRNALITTLLLLFYIVMNMMIMPHPEIMYWSGPVACIFGTLAGILISKKLVSH